MAQSEVYQGQTTTLEVEQKPGDTYSWEIYNDSTINFAVVPGDTPVTDANFISGNTGASVDVIWHEPGIYFYKVTAVDATGCTNNLKVGRIKIKEAIPTAELEILPDEICITDPSIITVTLTGNPAWKIVMEAEDEDGVIETFTYEDIGEDDNPFDITVSPDKTTTYRVIHVVDKYGENLDPSNTVTLTVHPLPDMTKIYLKE